MKEYLVQYSSSRWANAPYYKIIEANDAAEAEELAEIQCNEHMLEQFYDEDLEYCEEEGIEDPTELGAAAEIHSIELYDRDHPLYKYRDSIEN